MPASSGLYSAQVVAQLVNYVCVVGGLVFVVSSLYLHACIIWVIFCSSGSSIGKLCVCRWWLSICCVFSTFMPASSGLYSAQVVAQLVNYVCVVGGLVFVVSSLPSCLHHLGYILLKW